MMFITLLIVFGIWYFTDWLSQLQSHRLTNQYFAWAIAFFTKKQCPPMLLLLALVIIPLLIFLIVYVAIGGWLLGLLGGLINLLILAFSIDAIILPEQTTPLEGQTGADAARAQTKCVLWEGQHAVLGTLFWFCLLGGFGVLLYRLAYMIERYSDEQNIEPLKERAQRWLAYLDWLPARVIGLAYAIAGDFTRAWKYWIQFATQGLTSSYDLVIDTGLAALHANAMDPSKAEQGEAHKALRLIHRALLIWVIVLAIATLASWV